MTGGQFGWGEADEGWKKGPWTAQEDKLLIEHVRLHGEGRWNSVSNLTGLKRSGKSCRLRWVNYLRPDLKRGKITPHEENIIIELHARWGNRWSTIARCLPGRTDNEIKNYWRTHFKKAKCAKNLGKARPARLLGQPQEQQPQQHGESQVEHQIYMIRKIVSLLGDQEDEYYWPAWPPQQVPDLVCYKPYILLQSDASVADDVSIDEGAWGSLWNLENDLHAAAGDARGAGLQDCFTSSYMG